MSAISNFLSFLRSAIYAIDVRDGIADAIEQCYNDVNNPTLKTEALEAALQTKIDEGEMAALTIGDGTITGAKLANGTIPKAKLDPSITFDADPALDTTSTNAIQNKVVAGAISTLQADLGDVTETVVSNNLIDQSGIADGTTVIYANGELTGTALAFKNLFSLAEPYPIDISDYSTRYTLSFEAYTDGNAGTDSTGLYVGIVYDDGTKDGGYVTNATSEYTLKTIVSSATLTKHIVGIYFTYGSNANNIWHVKNIMLNKGTSALPYEPYSTYSAKDIFARNAISEAQADLGDVTETVAGIQTSVGAQAESIESINESLSSFKIVGGADKYFKNIKVYGSPTSIGITNIRNNYGPADAKQTGFAIFPTTTDTEWGSAIKNLSNIPISGHYRETLSDGRTYEFDYDLSSLASGTRDIARDAAHVIKQACFYDNSTLTEITEEAYGTIKHKTYTPITFNLSSQSNTQNGITWTQNADGTISVQGTATATAIISPQSSGGALAFSLSVGKVYRLRGCPVGGGNETYRLEVRDSLSSGTTLCIDTGNGVIFTVPESGSYYPIIRIASGQTVDLTFAIEIAEQTNTEETDVLTAVDLVAREIGRKNDVYFSLASDLIPGTTQTYVLSDGVVSQIIHKKSGITIRTDTYTYGTSTIIEVRSLSTGESLTITTNLETLATSIAYNEI